MTIYQTRQLSIEFERRVQTILPATESAAKLDSDTIFSFLNQFLLKYVHGLVETANNLREGLSLTSSAERVLTTLLTKINIEPTLNTSWEVENADIFSIPTDYLSYASSYTNVLSTYKDGERSQVLENMLGDHSVIAKMAGDAHNKLKILRKPILVICQSGEPIWNFVDGYIETPDPKAVLFHDRYTSVDSLDLLYYRSPKYFDIMTSVPCELPVECFDDLVTGAVDLYINYVRGGIRLQEEDGRRDRFDRRQAQREAEQNRE